MKENLCRNEKTTNEKESEQKMAIERDTQYEANMRRYLERIKIMEEMKKKK